MVDHKVLWNENGEIQENAIIPDIDIPAVLEIKNFDCDEDLAQYSETLLCDGDDAIAVMYAEDKDGNGVSLDLRVRGEVRVGYRESPDDDFVYYKHYSQFPPELTEILKNGEFSELVDIDNNNCIETVYYIYDSNGEELYCDGIVEEDITKMTPDDMKAHLMSLAEYCMEESYADGILDKPAATLNDVLSYANAQYHDAQKGDNIILRSFPEKGVDTAFTKNFDDDNAYSVTLFEHKGNKVLFKSSDHSYADLYNNIMDVATGEFGRNGVTVKNALESKNAQAKKAAKADVERE